MNRIKIIRLIKKLAQNYQGDGDYCLEDLKSFNIFELEFLRKRFEECEEEHGNFSRRGYHVWSTDIPKWNRLTNHRPTKYGWKYESGGFSIKCKKKEMWFDPTNMVELIDAELFEKVVL